MRLRCFIAPLLGVALACAAPLAAQEAPVALRIVALGDMPNGAAEETYPPYAALIAEINARAPDLVLHIGDTKGGRGPCTDARMAEQLAFLQDFAPPLLFTPGDNDWTDCHRAGHDPVERLAFLRGLFFAEPGRSFGQTALALEHQGAAGYPENARVRLGDIGIITAHVVGSNNNFEPRGLAPVEEFFARSAASVDWLERSFVQFHDAEMIVLAIHADMFQFDFDMFGRERWLRHSGFAAFGRALKLAARDFGKPVLLVFGDSHEHVVLRPFMRDAPGLMAVEVYGHPRMHALEFTLRPGAQEPIEIRRIANPLRP